MEYHFRYQLTADEFAEFNVFTVWQAPWQKKVRRKYFLNTFFYAIVFIVCADFIMEKINPGRSRNYLLSVATGISIAFLMTLLAIGYEGYRIRNKAKKLVLDEENIHILNETELEITDNGVTADDKTSKVHQSWSSITRYVVTNDFFYLYTNAIQAQIIPKRLFSGQPAIDEFDQYLSQKVPLSSSFRSMGI
jgi:hypothetical protein